MAAATPPPSPQAQPQPPTPPQEASLPPAEAAAPPRDDEVRLVFGGDNAKLSDEQKSQLGAMASRVKEMGDVRVQLMAFAGEGDLSASRARRLSLSRALAVRSYLIESGISSTRIDVRALGNKTEVKPMNRVDLKVGNR